METFVRLRSASVLLAFSIHSFLMPAALAESVPFSCTILPDGKSVRVAISNPFDRETSVPGELPIFHNVEGNEFRVSIGSGSELAACPRWVVFQFDCGGPVNIAQTRLANERTLDSIETPHQSVQAPFTHWDPFERPYVGPKGVGRKEQTHAQ
jgi:hypothetical protein